MRDRDTWVKTNIDYGVRWARLCVRANALARTTGWDLRAIGDGHAPEEVERTFYDMIEEFRPDLAGCTLVQIKYDVFYGWEFTVFHRSLPTVPDGHMPPLLSLFPEPRLIEDTDLVPIEQPEKQP